MRVDGGIHLCYPAPVLTGDRIRHVVPGDRSLHGGDCTMEGNRKSGTVKWFSRVKGYGFIAPDDDEKEIFVHFTGIEGEGYRNLEKGQRVSFVVEDTDKGPQAVAVRDQGIEATSWTAEPSDEGMEDGSEGEAPDLVA